MTTAEELDAVIANLQRIREGLALPESQRPRPKPIERPVAFSRLFRNLEERKLEVEELNRKLAAKELEMLVLNSSVDVLQTKLHIQNEAYKIVYTTLFNLTHALNNTSWSTWQSTAKFDEALKQANAYLDKKP